MPPRLLTAQEKNKLRKVCSEVDNWTAMGLWKGSGKEPNCYKFEKHNSTTTIVTDFKTQQDVDKWNSNGEATNRYKGYAVGAIVNLIAARFNLSVGTNTVLGIAQGEAGAKLFTYPKASIGSKYIVVTKFNYHPELLWLIQMEGELMKGIPKMSFILKSFPTHLQELYRWRHRN